MTYETELRPRYDSRKSFYSKAIMRNENGKIILTSYQTDVAYIENGKAHVNGTYSSTTLRHIKEFLIQNGFKADNSEQILKDYGEKKATTFATMTPEGKTTNVMKIELDKVKSSDPLAYAYGLFRGKSGQSMVKAEKGDKLAPEYIRGYKEGKKSSRREKNV